MKQQLQSVLSRAVYCLLAVALCAGFNSCGDDEVSPKSTQIGNDANSFTNTSVTDITCFSAKFATRMNLSGYYGYYGVCIDTIATPTTKLSCSNRNNEGNYSTTLRGLKGNTLYYYRPYVIISGTTHYGTTSSFRTLEDNVVITGEVDAGYKVKSKLTLGSDDYSSLQIGLCWSTTSSVPTAENASCLYVYGADDDNCYTIQLPTIYGTTYYRAFILIDGVAHYGKVKSVERKPNSNSHAYVDLGLPSGVLWATMNVGATTAEGYGDYFAWGETKPQSSNTYSWSSYKWMQSGSSSWKGCTKYTFADGQTSGCWYSNGTYVGTTVNGTTYKDLRKLELADDAAHVNWGGDWRMPTHAEQQQLYNNCTWTWTTQNSVNGYKVTSKTNGNSIFLPAAGYRSNGSLYYVGSVGTYWSSGLYSSGSDCAWLLYFNSSGVNTSDNNYRCSGQSVRPVLGSFSE